jgi:hypothetical protein
MLAQSDYLGGMTLSAPHLAGLGVLPRQIEEFKAILARAAEFMIAERPDRVRH